MLWDIFRCSCVFWGIPEGSEAFADILGCFVTFWYVPWVENILWRPGCSGTFWGILIRFERLLCNSDTYSWVLSSSEGFMKVLRSFSEVLRVFWGIIIGYEQFWNVSEDFDAFSDLLGCSEAFLGVIVCTEWFENGTEHSEAFFLLFSWCCEAFWDRVQTGSEPFLKDVLCNSGMFRDVLISSHVFWKVSEKSAAFFAFVGCS